MNQYSFFTAQLRFVASKTERTTPAIDEQMDALSSIADHIDRRGCFDVDANHVRIGARALAGVAGFLQQHILPEVITSNNDVGEKQVRWTIDTCMSLMATMMVHAETTSDFEAIQLTLPDAP